MKAVTNLPSIGIARLLVVTVTALLGLVACGGEEGPVTIRVAVLPILDALPLYVADEQGYFAEEELTVEFIGVSSAAERDQVMQAGEADAMINDLLSTMLYNAQESRIQVVRYARTATPEYPQFRILASSESGIEAVNDLKGREIGVSEGTVIEYTTDRLLEAEGFGPDDIVTVAVPSIPDRMSLLGSSELDAANLPDPLATLAVQGGARVIVDDASHPEYGYSVISFQQSFVEENEGAIRRFLAAVERAVEDINQDKRQFASLLSDRSLVPAPLLGSYIVPDFPLASVPLQSQWDDMLDWAMDKGYVEMELEYDDSIDDSFLP